MRIAECTIRYMYQLVHKEGRMARSHAEAESVTRAGPEAAWELVGDASSYCEWEPWSASGYQGVLSGARRERVRPSAVRTLRFIRSAVHRI